LASPSVNALPCAAFLKHDLASAGTALTTANAAATSANFEIFNIGSFSSTLSALHARLSFRLLDESPDRCASNVRAGLGGSGRPRSQKML